MSDRKAEGSLAPEVRWTLGCLVGAAALTGAAILVFLIAFALQPPTWAQVLLGVGLVAGGGLFTWLVASALGQSRARHLEDTPPTGETIPPTGSSGSPEL